MPIIHSDSGMTCLASLTFITNLPRPVHYEPYGPVVTCLVGRVDIRVVLAAALADIARVQLVISQREQLVQIGRLILCHPVERVQQLLIASHVRMAVADRRPRVAVDLVHGIDRYLLALAGGILLLPTS